MTEYNLYISNPTFYGSNQNNFEKNLSGKITINETIATSGMVERTAIGEVFGIPVPFINPQTNLVVDGNEGKIIKYGEPSMFSPAKVLATEMIAILKDEITTKYGVNIDFSTDAPKGTGDTTTTDSATTATTTATTTGNSGMVAQTAQVQTISQTGTSTNTINTILGTVLTGAAVSMIGSGISSLLNSNSGPSATSTIASTSSTSIPATTQAAITAPTTITATSSPITATSSATKPAIAPIGENKLKGIKILVPSQYLDVYEISKYGGVPALMTTKESKQMVWIDKEYDRPEFLPSNLTSPEKANDDGTGDFGINIHLGYPGGKKVGNWSEDGSQVFSTADELNDFFNLCETHKTKHGNKLTYTLATREDWDEAQKSVQTNKAVPDPGIAPAAPPAVEEKIAATQSDVTTNKPDNAKVGDYKITVKDAQTDIGKKIEGTISFETQGPQIRAVAVLRNLPNPFNNPETNLQVVNNTGDLNYTSDWFGSDIPKDSLANSTIRFFTDMIGSRYGVNVILQYEEIK
jgi:hypothetical protein